MSKSVPDVALVLLTIWMFSTQTVLFVSISYSLVYSARRTNASMLEYKCTKQCSITPQKTIFIVTAVRMSVDTLKPNK